MGIAKHKDNNLGLQEDDQSLALGNLAEAIVEGLHDLEGQSLEAFEKYVVGMRMKIHSESRNYKKRFSHGFAVLTDTLSKKKT